MWHLLIFLLDFCHLKWNFWLFPGIMSEQDTGSSLILGYQKPQGSGGIVI